MRSLDEDPSAFMVLLSAVSDPENANHFGYHLLERSGCGQTPQEECFCQLDRDEKLAVLEKGHFYLLDRLKDKTKEEEIISMEDDLASAVDSGDLEKAAEILSRLGAVFPEDEYVVYYRIYLLSLIGEGRDAIELSYAARILYSYEETIASLCNSVIDAYLKGGRENPEGEQE